MRRALAGVAVVIAALTLSGCADQQPARERAERVPVRAVETSEAPPPAPRFSRTTTTVTTLAASAAAIDRCAGPVAVTLGDDRPVLVAEHDYCGGSAWISRLRVGDALALDGAGVDADTYVVTEIGTDRRGTARVDNLPAADIVLQTCISPREIVLVGIERYQPALRS